MSWNNQGGGPWRSPGRGPWGQGPSGPQPTADLEEIIRRVQEALGKLARERAAIAANVLLEGTVIGLRIQNVPESAQEIVQGLLICPVLALDLEDPIENRRA